MKIKRDELLESIKELNKKKPLKENIEEDLGNTKVDVTATLDPADAARMKEHEDAIKAHDKRIEDSYKTDEVKEFLKETASEESRYSHFDCVDRKDLAKRINEAKEKGLDFKVGRNDKDGYRYSFEVLKEEYLKKDAGIPEMNTAAFNHAAGADSAPVCESVNEGDEVVVIDTSRDGYGIGQVVNNCFTVGELIEFLSNEFSEDMPVVLAFDRRYTFGALNGGCFTTMSASAEDAEDSGGHVVDDELLDEEIDTDVNEELKVYTSKLDNFHPSERSKDVWERIKEGGKVEDLEYALETIYPDGISDVALDDMLANEGDWVLDLVGLVEEPGETSVDDFKDEEIEPFDSGDDFEDVEDVVDEPAEDIEDAVEEPVEDEPVEDKSYDAYDDEDDVEPLDLDEPSHEEAVEEIKDEKDDEEPEDKKELKEDVQQADEKPADEKPEEEKCEDGECEGTKIVEPDDSDDKLTEAIGDGFVKSAYKGGFKCTEEEFGKITPQEQIKEAVESVPEEDDEVVAVDDGEINEMCGFAKPADDKKEESK